MLWRLRAEQTNGTSVAQLEKTERRARKLIAGSLFILAAYVVVDATLTLRGGDRPHYSAVGVALLALSIAVMIWLARSKRRLAQELPGDAMAADALQTTAYW